MLPSPLYLSLLARQVQFNWHTNIYQVWYDSSDQNHPQWKVSKSPAYSESAGWVLEILREIQFVVQKERAQTVFGDPSLMMPKRNRDHGPCYWHHTGGTQEFGQLQKYIFCKYISKGNKLPVLTLLGYNCWGWWKEDTVAVVAAPVLAVEGNLSATLAWVKPNK